MIVKNLEKSLFILKTETLLNRMKRDHEQYEEIQENVRKLIAGFNGERAVSYYLNFLDEKNYFIFHNLRLPNGKYFFQLDFLILTKRFALILECKNFYGTLFFDDSFNQLIRFTEDKEEGFLDPISQAKWHQQQLQNWLSPFSLPVEYFVVISNPSTIVKTNPQNKIAMNRVIHCHSLLEKIEFLNRKYRNDTLNNKELKKISRRLLKEHSIETVDILKKYELTDDDILTGVQCSNCSTFGMNYTYGTWTCPKCLIKSKVAHIQTLKEYALLYEPHITNREFRRFLHVDCSDAAYYLLKSLNFDHSGGTKNRFYRLDSLIT